MNTINYANRYAKTADFAGIQMQLIGFWMDLAAYYSGSDGNAWKWQGGIGARGSWVNMGDAEQFKANLKVGKSRGKLIEPSAPPILTTAQHNAFPKGRW